MKNLLKLLPVLFLFATVLVACDKDDDPVIKSPKLTAVKYNPNSITSKPKIAFKSSAIEITPDKAKATFTIKDIKKDGEKFTNPGKKEGFQIDANGKVFADKDHKLGNGVYVVTVSAKDASDSKNVKTTTIKVIISDLEKLTSIVYDPNNITGKLKKDFKSSAVKITPTKAQATFTISKITKDEKDFTNPGEGKGFKIDASKGEVYAETEHKLEKATYVVTVTAKDKLDNDVVKTTTLKVVID
ncbi:cadherin repeat domain-containing protein [Flavivirga eckloniae]|uniref:Cadherin domain-containing protein n=1 Tax=Flavivirga eckloniae TaxID=1803846 RepID=A0A2K9PQS3_9FLAO|nr:cadherin repeat domain-containing protein [Flavivirga eckloniae]AUP79411.1 hypothetical protein C1H87_12105 [Flavivirga eckloniae]